MARPRPVHLFFPPALQGTSTEFKPGRNSAPSQLNPPSPTSKPDASPRTLQQRTWSASASEEKSGERTKSLIFELRVAASRGPLSCAFRGWMPCDEGGAQRAHS